MRAFEPARTITSRTNAQPTGRPTGTTASYRADIDGMRAIAVIAVLFYHLNMRGVGGGYLGVDIFFVISGFLITGIIDRELRAGTFSIGRFYERRVRRIFPALFAMLAVMLACGSIWLLPNEFADLGKSVIAAALSMANVLFFATDSYFGPVLAVAPLLHTWSLAVEEQFYLVFPLLLIGLYRFATRWLKPSIWIFTGVSLLLNIVLLQQHPTAAFYLPMPRAWELLLGALLALGAVPPLERAWQRETLGWIGLAMIAAALILPAHGGILVIPDGLSVSAGTVLMLMAGNPLPSRASRVLALSPLRYVGLISYSLYIWHWPVLVMFKLTVRSEPVRFDKPLLILICLVIAALSERFIERPFRHATPGRRKAALTVGGVSVVAFAALGLAAVVTDGATFRFPEKVIRLASYMRYGDLQTFRTNTCFLSSDSNDISYFPIEQCLAHDPARRNFLLLGDSHAAHLWIGLKKNYPDINFMQATAAGCKPWLHPDDSGPGGRACRDLMTFVMRRFLPGRTVNAVIISARWPNDDTAELRETIAYIKQFTETVYVVGPIVEYQTPLPRILALSTLHDDPTMIMREREPAPFAHDRAIEAGLAGSGANYISMIQTMCPGGACWTVASDGVPVQFDYGHLSEEGSDMVARRWHRQGLFEVSDAAGVGHTGKP